MRVCGGSVVVMVAVLVGMEALAESGALRVEVRDPAGDPLPGATVTLASDVQRVPVSAVTTGPDGVAVFPVLQGGGGYAIEVGFPGYARQHVSGIRIRSAERSDVSIRLTSEIREAVEVAATRPVVDLDTAVAPTKFSDAFIRDLPVAGRFYQNVLTMAPGVLDSDGDGNPNVHGARSRDFKAQVNGVSNVDPLTGQWLSYVNPDSVEDLEVVPWGAGVASGRAQGGFASIVQKQGSNDFEGVVQLLYASSQLDGNGASDLPMNRVGSFQTFQPSVQVTGPILRDRIWFRLSHMWVDRQDPVDVGVSVETVGLDQQVHSDQITWQASPRNKLVLQYDSDPTRKSRINVSSRIPAESAQDFEFGGPTWRLGWTAAWSPRLLVDSAVSWQDHRVNLLPSSPGIENDCVENTVYPVLDAAQCLYTNRNETQGSFYRTSRDHRQRLTVQSRMEMYGGRLWGASHQITLGVSMENERYSRDLELAPDLLFTTYRAGIGFYGDASYRLPVPPSSTAEVRGSNGAIYLEDRIRPHTNLTVSVGVRLDREAIDGLGWTWFDPEAEQELFRRRLAAGWSSVPLTKAVFTAYQEVAQFQASLGQTLDVSPDETPLSAIAVQGAFWRHRRSRANLTIRNTNLTPRLSLAWDPRGDGKTKLALSAGRYYNAIPLAVPLIEQEPADVVMEFLSHRVYERERGFYYVTFDQPGTIGATINQRRVAPALRTPYQDELALAFEREVASDTSLRLALLRRKFRDQLQDANVNHIPGDYGRCRLDDPYVGWYVDPTHGPDGILDDCRHGGDGVPDLYTQDPGWGSILQVGNYNTADYRAAIAEINRRFHGGWGLDASYTWSEAVGDAEDFDQILGNDRTRRDDERGPLAYDQRHVVKLHGTAAIGGGVHLGGTVTWDSGLPYSVLETAYSAFVVPPQNVGAPEDRAGFEFPTGHRNDQRSPSGWNFEVRVAKDWTVARRATLQLSAECFNLMNNGRLRVLDTTDGVPNFVRQFGRRWQVGMRLAF